MNLKSRKAIAVALALAAIGAPAAHAGHQDLGADVALAQARGGAASSLQQQPTAVDRLRSQEDARRYDPRLYEGVVSAPARPVAVQAVTSEGFDWSDAGVGAGVSVGALLLAAAGAIAVRRRRSRLASL